jgi:PadR family transcriptional regulator
MVVRVRLWVGDPRIGRSAGEQESLAPGHSPAQGRARPRGAGNGIGAGQQVMLVRGRGGAYIVSMTRSWLGEFEHLVLLAILRLDDDATAPAILDEIETRSGRPASRGSIYITLDRLEDKGLLRSQMRDGPAERGGRPRRYLQLTRDGIAALRESREALQGMWKGMERRLNRG